MILVHDSIEHVYVYCQVPTADISTRSSRKPKITDSYRSQFYNINPDMIPAGYLPDQLN